MKPFFATLFFLSLPILSFAQLPADLKYDELSWSFDSTTVLMRDGKWSSVYSVPYGKSVIAPAKAVLVNFPGSNVYAQISPKSGQKIIYWIDGEAVRHISGRQDDCYLGFPDPASNSSVINVSGQLFERDSARMIYDPYYVDCTWEKFAIEKIDGERVILTHYKGWNAQFQSTTDEWILGDDVNASGVYNLKNKTWEIDPVYHSCHLLNGYLFCQTKLSQVSWNPAWKNVTPPQVDWGYDIFQLNENGFELMVAGAVEVEDDLLAGVLHVDGVEKLAEDFYRITSDNGSGLVHFQLHRGEELTDPYLACAILYPPVADFVVVNAELAKMIVVDLDTTYNVQLYHLADPTNTGSGKMEAVFNAGDEKRVGYYRNGTRDTIKLIDESPNFGVIIVEDPFIIVNDYFIENGPAVPSIMFPAEDSVDANGNVVYEPSNYWFRSGVYNLYYEDWLVPAEYKTVYTADSHFLAQTGVAPDAIEGSTSTFTLVNYDAHWLKNHMPEQEVYGNPDYVKFFLWNEYRADEIFDSPGGYLHHMELPSRRQYYVRFGDSLAIYSPELEWGETRQPSQLRHGPLEFVHENKDLGLLFWLTKDSIHMETQFGHRQVSRENGKIIFEYIEGTEGWDSYPPRHRIWLIENKDTAFYDGWDDFTFVITHSIASIEINGDELIVNDQSYSDYSVTTWNESVPGTVVQSENSSVWKLVDGQWQKKTPYYASITKIDGGYIAGSGELKELRSVTLEGPAYQYVPARYFVLDSNYNAVAYYDYYDFPLVKDLGFGLKVCLDNGGCFFMTYDLVPVTDAGWDDFELHNGKLKAIITEKPLLDENGEKVLDEQGVPVMAAESVTKFFKIP
jgi:hypothetical protein